MFVAPSKLGSDQYSSVFDLVRHGKMCVPLFMTTESAYMKTLVGLSAGLKGEKLIRFMNQEINFESCN